MPGVPTPSRPFDVAVVGAGPAGAVCALHLARQGLRVAVLEKSVPPRYKACGGGLTPRARHLLDVDLGGAAERLCHVVELNLLDAGLAFRVERDEPLVTMTMRADLDARLLQAAVDAGAELVTPCTVRALERDNRRLELTTSRGTVAARYAVAADGAASATARAAGWGPNPHEAPALESELRVSLEVYDRFAGSARFDFDTVARGYAWVFPKKPGHLSVGCGSIRRPARGLKGELERYLGRLGLDAFRHREDHGFVIPVAPRSARLARDRVLLAGDAAGLADPVTCEGISHAVLSGRLAAAAVAEGFDDPIAVESLYGQRVAAEILGDLRVARGLARLLYGFPRLRRLVFRVAGRRLSEAVADVVSGRRGYADLLTRTNRRPPAGVS
jgi:geranylgeranyl reductase family protein